MSVEAKSERGILEFIKFGIESGSSVGVSRQVAILSTSVAKCDMVQNSARPTFLLMILDCSVHFIAYLCNIFVLLSGAH